MPAYLFESSELTLCHAFGARIQMLGNAIQCFLDLRQLRLRVLIPLHKLRWSFSAPIK